MVSFVYFALGVLAGGIFGLFFYVKAGKQLVEETAELRRLSTLVLRGLESAGLVKWSRDEDDRIIGITFMLQAKIGAATLTGHNPEITAG